MSDAIHSDHYVVPPAIVLEQQLAMIRSDMENINARLPTGDFYLIRDQRDTLREIARLASEAVQKIDSRDWADRRVA